MIKEKHHYELTVIMSVYNGEEYLSLAIESILSQTFKSFEFIIVNNGSLDKTGTILNYYASKDNRIKIINSKKNLTYVEGRTLGIKECKTNWFALMDADDISLKERLEKQMKVIRSDLGSELAALGTWGEYINSKGEVLGRMRSGPKSLDEFNNLFKFNKAILLIDPSAIINRELFWKCKGYNKDAVPSSDLDFWYRLSETGKKIIAIPEILIKYRVHHNSTSVNQTMLQRKKGHFINFNMRRRRNNIKEMSYEDYCLKIWSNPKYRLPKIINDFSMYLYKKAGLYYGEKKYYYFLLYLLLVLFLNPKYLVKKIYSQKFRTIN